MNLDQMTAEEKQAYEWARSQQFQSVAARYARTLAKLIERAADETETLRQMVIRDGGKIRTLREALEIYAKPENWQCHKRQERIIWNYHPYEDGFKIAQSALRQSEGGGE